MIVRKYIKGDFDKLELQAAQRCGNELDNLKIDDISETTDIWVGEHEGKIIAMGGVVEIWNNRGEAWMLISKHAKFSLMLSVHKEVANYLKRSNYRRIESTVDVGFKQGHRWMKMLGFELEGYLKAYRPDGKDMILFARVRR